MRFTDTLPQPTDTAFAHSQRLAEYICDTLQTQNGHIGFREFMHMALYAPALGYYVAGAHKIGASGDFITAPEISPLFSQCLANQCKQVLQALDGGDILELGAGSGIMAADILKHLDSTDCLPENYYILEVSPDLKQRQHQALAQHVPHLLERVIWLDALPTQPVRGVIVGNEVLDAMPVDVFILDSGEIYEQTVTLDDNQQFAFGRQPANSTLRDNIKQLSLDSNNYPNGYTSELNPQLPGWLNSLGQSLEAGAILLVDYGYERKDYYLPERAQGTLICHYQHRAHDNPLLYPGLQDITANADFTAVAEAATQADLHVAGYTTQANFLINAGLEALFATQLQQKPKQQYPLAQQVRTLSLPSEMGERFKVIGLTKGFTNDLMGFTLSDQRHRL